MGGVKQVVPFSDLRAAYEELREEFDEAYRRFMRTGWYVLGPEVARFEEEYAAYCECQRCVGVGSGLQALHLALVAIGVGSGDEVIVPSNTYIATWLAVTHAGGSPVPVEPDARTHNIDSGLVEEAITRRTKAILAVNLYGQPCDYDAILGVARKHGLKVVVDNAQAHGARYKGRRVGGIGDVECHSFYPSKNLGAFGEGGAITTNDEALADRVTVLRHYGSRVRYHHEVPGYNARLDELQAAFLRIKLRRLDEWNDRRRLVARRYLSGLRQYEDLLGLPEVPSWAEPVWHLFVVRHGQRDQLQSGLKERGIETLIHYPIPPHLSGAYENAGFEKGQFPVAERLASEVLSLPIGPFMRKAQVDRVILAVGECLTARRSSHPKQQ